MPLNVKRFCASISFLLFAFIFVYPQTAPNQTTNTTTAAEPTAAEVMRTRIAKAKSFIAVRNYNAAIYELENIKRESKDTSVHSVINILLMHSFIEQNDYKRAQGFLASFYKDLKSNKPEAATNYYAVAGQVVKAARNQFERYRGLGLSVADRNLPLEALVDIDKMRETLEAVIEQTKTLGADKKQSAASLPILEEAVGARSSLARDDYDANHWKQEITDARESLVDSTSKVTNAVDGTTETPIAANVPASKPDTTISKSPTVTKNPAPPEIKPVPTDNTAAEKPVSPKPETTANNSDNAPVKNPRERIIVGENQEKNKPPTETAANDNPAPNDGEKNAANDEPLSVGSLIGYATRRTDPIYPAAAKNLRMSGTVKLDVIIDEQGKVTEITKSSGPSMLQRAAEDALKKWQFKPFLRDGQPVKAIGFVSFNFNL